jgi:PKD repeat protein
MGRGTSGRDVRPRASRRGLWFGGLVAIGALVLAACVPPPPPPGPPATLHVLPVCGAAALSVTADAFGTDPTGITAYQFDFGDGTVVHRTPANRVAQHTYAAAGTYTITLTITDSNGSTGVTSTPVSVVAPQALSLPVSVGYADSSTVHQPAASGAFPSPWAGSPNVTYAGTSSDIDAGAIKIDNPTGSPVSCISVKVQIGGVGFNLWNDLTAPPHGSLILTETAHQNFDTSDTSDQGSCAAPSASQPTITVWSPGGVATHVDTGQVLNTGGSDIGHCPPTGTQARNESHPWVALS